VCPQPKRSVMNQIKTQELSADTAGLAQAAAILDAGGLVSFPTETVYGLGADARDDVAVAKIYEAKGRPSFNPLIVHLTNVAALTGRLRPHRRTHLVGLAPQRPNMCWLV